MGLGIALWLECQACDRKVAGLNPCRSGGRIFFSRVNFLCWLLFRYPFHPRVTAVACKRPRSFCQKCRWQVTAKHAYTLHMWLCMKWYGTWLYGVHRMRQEGSSFMWHQPCQLCKYTTSVDIQKRASHSCRITCERSESTWERRIALYKKAINKIQAVINWYEDFFFFLSFFSSSVFVAVFFVDLKKMGSCVLLWEVKCILNLLLIKLSW